MIEPSSSEEDDDEVVDAGSGPKGPQGGQGGPRGNANVSNGNLSGPRYVGSIPII